MTNDQILDKIYPGCDCIEAYKARGLVDPGCARCNTIDFTLEAMEEARKDEAVEFGKFLLNYNSIDIGRGDTRWWDKTIGGHYYTTDLLYQLFKQSK